MEDKKFTAKDIGEKLSKAFGGDAAYIQRQVRHWQKLGFLEPIEFVGNGANARAIFSFEDLCKASLFSALTKLRWEAKELEAINDDLYPDLSSDLGVDAINWGLEGPPESYQGEGFFSSKGLIPDAIRGIKAGENWKLIVSVHSDGKYKAELDWLVEARENSQGRADDALAAYAQAIGIPKTEVIAQTSIKLNRIIEPLLESE